MGLVRRFTLGLNVLNQPCAVGSAGQPALAADPGSAGAAQPSPHTPLTTGPRYHSHPVFEARPSQKDNENQRNYQALCHDPDTGLAPWVGAIVSPFDPGLPSAVGWRGFFLRLWGKPS